MHVWSYQVYVKSDTENKESFPLVCKPMKVSVKVGILLYIIREEAQSFATHDLRCRVCLPNSELAVWWTSVSRWFLA